jgi:uncharacterized membrane protein
LKKIVFHIVLAVLCAVVVTIMTDHLVLSAWDDDSGWIVRLGSVEALDPLLEETGQEEDPAWRTVPYRVEVEILTGERQGQWTSVEIEHLAGSALELREGKRYLLMRDVFDDGSDLFSFSDAYRMPLVVGVTTLCMGVLLAAAGQAGFRALLGLVLSLVVLLGWYIPGLTRGLSPVPFAVLASAGISFCTVFTVVRRSRYRMVAFWGAVGGAVAASLTGWFMVSLWRLTGLAGEGAPLLASTFPCMSLRGFLLAAVIIGSIGAVLDVAISVTSALSELKEHAPHLGAPALWKSGLGVGREILGSMINTLILAYLGGALPLTVVIAAAHPNLFGLLNDPAVAEEVMRSLAGTIGLLLAVPLTTLFFILKSRKLGEEPSEKLG